ncbi:hypothetical protein H9Q13_15575 [Pontibacter sp. JH31]|uniref:DUF6089 domain-containing protein n=1 Tax=Pontibacter aquaedesilientis TaxID=2766980 RepID=A0ABR7XJZ5_9BACT|nr:DUF6089 family protein [Pontibacter aquaedesilientis]MBD1398592.1 hypothetical protein [Pontibacter aquaedesilientis]
MKKFVTLLLLLAVSFAVVSTEAEAQRFTKRKRYATVGVTLGASNYFGDLVPQADFTSMRLKSTRPSVGINYTFRHFPRVSSRYSFQWNRIAGDDAKAAGPDEGENMGRYRRNLSFRNDIKELSAVAIIDLFENRHYYRRRPDFVPYAYAGIAVFHHNPKAYYENGSHPGLSPDLDIATGWYALQPLGTEGQYLDVEGTVSDPYKRIQIAIPFGLGVRYKLDRNWDFSFEMGWRATFTDYLDDVSTAHVNKSDLLSEGNRSSNRNASVIFSDRSAEAGFNSELVKDPSGYSRLPKYGTNNNRTRGNSSDNDWYIQTSLGLNYILSPRVRSPKFR